MGQKCNPRTLTEKHGGLTHSRECMGHFKGFIPKESPGRLGRRMQVSPSFHDKTTLDVSSAQPARIMSHRTQSLGARCPELQCCPCRAPPCDTGHLTSPWPSFVTGGQDMAELFLIHQGSQMQVPLFGCFLCFQLKASSLPGTFGLHKTRRVFLLP